MTTRALPACALALVQRFEGLHDGDRKTPLVLEPQADPIGIYTVGWGYALFDKGRAVKDRETAYRIWRARWPGGLMRVEADALLRQVAQAVCDKVVGLLPGLAPTDGQLGARRAAARISPTAACGGGCWPATSRGRPTPSACGASPAAASCRGWSPAARPSAPCSWAAWPDFDTSKENAMKRLFSPQWGLLSGLLLAVPLSGCASDPVALAQAVRILDEGCQRTVDLNLDKSQPGGGALRVTRDCAPVAAVQPEAAPKP